MESDNHAVHLGGLIANFHSLEFILRSFLQKQPNARPYNLPFGKDLYTYPVGTELEVNEMTSFDSLGELVKKFNKFAKNENLKLLDERIVDIRDALAHGRISAPSSNYQLRLIKFSRPNKNNKVKISFNEILTDDWFVLHKKLVYDSIIYVSSLMK
jgi:hypothetical protein